MPQLRCDRRALAATGSRSELPLFQSVDEYFYCPECWEQWHGTSPLGGAAGLRLVPLLIAGVTTVDENRAAWEELLARVPPPEPPEEPPAPKQDDLEDSETTVTMQIEMMCDTSVVGRAARAAHREDFKEPSPGDVVFDRYTVASLVGKGTHSRAYRVHDQETDTFECLKIDDNMDLRLAMDLQMVYSRIKSKDKDGLFPKLRRVFFGYERFFLVEELVEGMNCAQQLESNPNWFRSMPRLRALARSVLRILVVLHAARVIHCDLHPENIVMTSDGRFRLVDFGCSRVDVDPWWAKKEHGAGHVGHQSIEMLTADYVGTKTDIWSLGVTLCELCCGRNLWRSPSDRFPELMTQMQGLEPDAANWVAGRGLQSANFRDHFTPQGRPVRNTGNGRLEVLEPVGTLEDILELGSEGASFVDLVRNCLRPDQRLRPTASDLLEHPFFQEE
jgi:serine/threonine protein kinase